MGIASNLETMTYGFCKFGSGSGYVPTGLNFAFSGAHDKEVFTRTAQEWSPRGPIKSGPALTTPLFDGPVLATRSRDTLGPEPPRRAAGGRDLDFRMPHIELCVIRTDFRPTPAKERDARHVNMPFLGRIGANMSPKCTA